MIEKPEGYPPNAPATWTAVLRAAADSEDHTVELTTNTNHGIQVEIDGVPMFPYGAYPLETFTLANQYEWVGIVTDEMVEKVEEVFSDAD